MHTSGMINYILHMFATMLHYLRCVISLKKDVRRGTKSLYDPLILTWDPLLLMKMQFTVR